METWSSVRKLDKEIKQMVKERAKKDDIKKDIDDKLKRLASEICKLKESEKASNISEDISKDSDESEKKGKQKRRYFNSGYCKYKGKCRFLHPKRICIQYLEGKCKGHGCPDRHPKACKWVKEELGCRRNEESNFSHDPRICSEIVKKESENNHFQCVSCKHEWRESQHVVKHMVENTEVYFCLNYNDWVKKKNRVLDQGWSLFDLYGNLSHFV